MFCMHHASRLMPSPQVSDFEVLKGLIGHEQGLHGLYDANQWLIGHEQGLHGSRASRG